MQPPSPAPRLGAIAVLLHEDRFLLVQRGKDPGRGLWGFPGGHVEMGETALAAAVRELKEETGVQARALDYLTNVDVIEPAENGGIAYQYLLAVVICAYESGDPVASDDAAAAEWVPVADVLSNDRQTVKDVADVARLALRHFA